MASAGPPSLDKNEVLSFLYPPIRVPGRYTVGGGERDRCALVLVDLGRTAETAVSNRCPARPPTDPRNVPEHTSLACLYSSVVSAGLLDIRGGGSAGKRPLFGFAVTAKENSVLGKRCHVGMALSNQSNLHIRIHVLKVAAVDGICYRVNQNKSKRSCKLFSLSVYQLVSPPNLPCFIKRPTLVPGNLPLEVGNPSISQEIQKPSFWGCGAFGANRILHGFDARTGRIQECMDDSFLSVRGRTASSAAAGGGILPTS